ncbi:MAG: hypothetical protein WDN04_05660 [Rhodospirillales bacterium]
MTEPPPPDAPPPSVRRRTEAARLRGSPDSGAMPRMETVRITAPDLVRRAALERTRQRLVFAAGGFFAAVRRGSRETHVRHHPVPDGDLAGGVALRHPARTRGGGARCAADDR